MTITFRPAVRSNVGLLIGLAGASGSGKTYTAMRLARGIAGDKPFAVIDTEAGRATHYADAFRFDHADLAPPFRPERYAEAIIAADKAGYPVIVIDSMSHVWAGDGGVLDWQEEELERMAGQDYGKREACKMAAWIKPKTAHKHMVAKLLQVRAHLILCFRAEPKVEMVKVNGKWTIQPKQSPTGLDGWLPICEKNLPYELTASFLLTADAPGVPKPIKLQAQHRALFPLDVPITEESGKRIAEWATGGTAHPPDEPLAKLREASMGGTKVLRAVWSGLTDAQRDQLKPELDSLKAAAAKADTPPAAAPSDPDSRPPLELDGAPPVITFAMVMAAINEAQTLDILELASDMIPCVIDERQRAELDVEARARRKELAK